MDVADAVKARRSVRKYKSTPVPEEALKKVLNAARLAPSAANLQPWKFVIVMDEDVKRQLAAACNSMNWISRAPIVIVACANMDVAIAMIGGYMNSAPVDVAIALTQMSLVATSEGLGTCWIGAFKEEKVAALLNIPKDCRVVSVMTLGYPDEAPGNPGRKNISEIVSYNKFE